MNQQNNIDDLFKNSAQQFSAPAPKKSWAKIDGVLKQKRKVILIQKVLLAATVVIIASVVFFVNIDNITSPQVVDGDIETTIETPILKTNTNNITTEPKSSKVVNNDNIIENNSVDNTFNKEEKESDIESKENIESKIVNVDTPLEEVPKSKINDVEDNNIIVNKATEDKTLELNIEKEVATTAIIAKSSEGVINKEESLNNAIPKETVKEINTLNEKELSQEVAEAEINAPIEKEITIEEPKEEVRKEIAVGTVEGKTSEVEEGTIKQETESPETKTPYTEENKVVETEITEATKENHNAIAAIPKKAEIDFLIGQTYGFTVTNGIGKTPEIDNPTLSEAGATKANTWFSAAVNFELDVNNWVVKSGVRRYNLEIHGDFEVKQKNPWNVDLDQYAFSELGYIKILNINTNLRLSKPSSIIYIQDFNRYDIKVRYVDIPLSVGYKFRFNKLSLVPHVGANYTIAYSNEVKLQSEDGYYMFGEVTDLKQLMVGVSAGCGAYYDISKHWMVGLDTEMVYYPSTVSTNSTFSYKPYSLLVGPSIAFKF